MTEIIRASDLEHIELNGLAGRELIGSVIKLVTQEAVLAQEHFELPQVIHPNKHLSFNSLLLNRDNIRDLRLVPIKDDTLHDNYNAIRDDPKLVTDVLTLLGDDELVLAPNKFPYYLPPGVDQWLLWINPPNTPKFKVLTFIARAMLYLELDEDDVIIFERPLRNKSKLVKGTFPAIRHIHFWSRAWKAE